MIIRINSFGRQIIRFGFVGISATIVHYCTALLLANMIPLAYANPVGFILAFSVSYFGHLRLTFGIRNNETNHAVRLPRFLVVSLLGFVVGQMVLLGSTHLRMFPEWLSLLVAVATVPVTTFVVSRSWVFRTPGSRVGQQVQVDEGDESPPDSLDI
jgi:putative flippase GtrA